MLEQELKEIWKNSAQVEKVKFETSRLMIDLNTKMDRIEKDIRKRDRREISASVLGILMFGYFAFAIPFIITKVASVLGMIWFVYVIYKLRNVKKHKLPINLSLSFREQLENQKNYMLQEAKLLDTVLYWYVLPPFVINVIFIMGLGEPIDLGWTHKLTEVLPFTLKSKLTVLAFIAVFYAFIVWLNKRAVKKEFNPFIEKINHVLEQLKNDA